MINKKMGIVLIVLLCISIALNIATIAKMYSDQRKETSNYYDDTNAQQYKETGDSKIDPAIVSDIYLGYQYTPRNSVFNDKYYHLNMATNKCVFDYRDSNKKEHQCDFSKDIFNDFLDLILSQDLEEYQYKTDLNGKIEYDVEPYILGLSFNGQVVYYENPSNMDEIIAKFEELVEAAGWQEEIKKTSPSDAPVHAENEIFPDSDSKRLNNSDIADMDMAQLKKALDEIYARHNNGEEQKNTRTDKDYNEILNKIEKYNVEVLKNAIREIEEKAA